MGGNVRELEWLKYFEKEPNGGLTLPDIKTKLQSLKQRRIDRAGTQTGETDGIDSPTRHGLLILTDTKAIQWRKDSLSPNVAETFGHLNTRK